MKRKTLLSLTIVISMMLAALPLVVPAKAQNTTVAIEFENGSNWIEKTPCNNFVVTVNITLDPGEQIDFVALEIHYDTSVLELKTNSTNDITEGPWMKSFGATAFAVASVDPVAGIINDIACGYMAAFKATGSGDFCYINFHCKKPGDGNITIFSPAPPGTESYLLDGANLVNIDATIDGTVHQPFPLPQPPVADFDLPLMVDVCTNITLDGTGSYAGLDTDPIEECDIIEYKWEIDDDGVPGVDITLYGDVVIYHCHVAGVATITLTINSTDPTPPGVGIWADGWETDSETHTVLQKAPSVGAGIDVYTSKSSLPGDVPSGKGPFYDEEGDPYGYPIGWSDAYGPQEEVCVHAKVTYNDEPVANKPVGFEMINGLGESVDFRTDFTDEDGIATVCFRIPWEGMNATGSFGNWSIVGTVDVAGSIVSDTVMFQYGWIISIRDIIVTGSPLKKGQTLTIDVDLQSISMIPRDVLVTIVACDECGVPIGLAKDYFTVDPEDGMVVPSHTITIPSWAFVGTGTIYVNVFTDYPSLGGVPYCPEGTDFFVIKKTSDP